VILLGCLLLLSIILQLANPQIVRYYIDSFELLEGELISIDLLNRRLTEAAILYFIIALIQQTLYVISVYISQVLAWRSTNNLRVDLTDHCINLDMTFHNNQSPGKFIERIDGDITTLSNFFSQFILLVIVNIILIIGILIVLFNENFFLGVAFTLFSVVTLVSLYFIWNFAVPYWKKVRQASADLLGFVEEGISGKEDIVALGASSYVLKRFHHYSKIEYDSTVKAIFISRIIQIAIMGMVAFGSTLVFVIGIPLVRTNTISVGTIFMINSYVSLLFRPIINIVRQAQDLNLADASIDRVNEFFHTKKVILDYGDKEIYPTTPLKLSFDHVTFGYKTDNPVIKDLSFALDPGNVLGVIGKTGSGKTTVSRLIFRLYDPLDGTIKLNGYNAKDIKLQNLRENVAYVTQNVELFQSSLRDNITFFDKSIPDSAILKVIKDLGLESWYNRLTDGLDTQLLMSKNGGGFSAGEAQLLALTRVFLRDPCLVVLDEASSRLDPVTEELIESTINQLLTNRTAIIIAHRLKTLEQADYILHLENGEIQEFGKRVELMNNPNSHFSKLLKTGMEEVLG
jgi:ATP-binding cassette subfamily B protein